MEKLKGNLLKLLKEDARYTPSIIANMLGESVDRVRAAIADLESSGVIAGYCAVINADKLEGETVEALIEVRVTPQRNRGFDAIAEEIYKFSEVKNLYLMSGGFDLAVFIEGKNLREVALFVSEKLSLIENVISTATHFILKKYKIEGIVAVSENKMTRLPFQP